MHDLGLPATVDPQDHGGASAQCSGDAYMSKFNWRSPADFYQRIEGAEMTGLAWECLRRNPEFRRHYPLALPSSVSMGAEFRQKWGLMFRS